MLHVTLGLYIIYPLALKSKSRRAIILNSDKLLRFHIHSRFIFFFVSHIYADKEVLMENAVSMATQIAEKSPVAVAGTKAGLNYARDHNVDEGLQQIVSYQL